MTQPPAPGKPKPPRGGLAATLRKRPLLAAGGAAGVLVAGVAYWRSRSSSSSASGTSGTADTVQGTATPYDYAGYQGDTGASLSSQMESLQDQLLSQEQQIQGLQHPPKKHRRPKKKHHPGKHHRRKKKPAWGGGQPPNPPPGPRRRSGSSSTGRRPGRRMGGQIR